MSAPAHHRPVSPVEVAVARSGQRSPARCEWWRDGEVWTVRLTGPFGEVHATAADAFDALLAVREQVEPDGWRVGVAGARPDVWPSGMARETGGLVAYRLAPGVRPGRADLVDVFAAVDPGEVGDVATQRARADAVLG